MMDLKICSFCKSTWIYQAGSLMFDPNNPSLVGQSISSIDWLETYYCHACEENVDAETVRVNSKEEMEKYY